MINIITMLFGLTLSIIGIAFIIKNFVINYKAADSGFKLIMTMALSVLSSILGVNSLYLQLRAKSLEKAIEGLTETSDKLSLLIIQIAQSVKNARNSILIGAIFFLIAYLLFKNMQKEIKKEYDKPKKLWDLSSLNKK